MAEHDSIIELMDVRKRYATIKGTDAPMVLNGVKLTVQPGETIAIVGPSGSGKSTLLNMIGTLDRPSEGKVLLNGVDLNTLNERQQAQLRNREIGFIFQEHHLLPQCTALENVQIPTLARKDAALRRVAAETANRLLNRVGLGGQIHHRPGQLSNGQCQRVAVVRALINQPKLLLADEPTGSLDHATAAALTDLLLELNREERVTLIVATHADELANCMNRVVELRDGVLWARGDHP